MNATKKLCVMLKTWIITKVENPPIIKSFRSLHFWFHIRIEEGKTPKWSKMRWH